MVEPLLEKFEDQEAGRGRSDPEDFERVIRHAWASARRNSTFFNSRVDIVPGVVEAFLQFREARLNTRASLGIIMSGKKSVEKAHEVTIYLDIEVRTPYSVVLR